MKIYHFILRTIKPAIVSKLSRSLKCFLMKLLNDFKRIINFKGIKKRSDCYFIKAEFFADKSFIDI